MSTINAIIIYQDHRKGTKGAKFAKGFSEVVSIESTLENILFFNFNHYTEIPFFFLLCALRVLCGFAVIL